MAAVAIEVKERPILFSGPMVKAILEGKKTQTRRVMKTQPLGYKQDPNCVFVAEDGSEKISEWFTLTPKEYAKAYTEKYYGDNWQKAKHYRSSHKFAQVNQYNSYHPNVLSIHEYAYGCPYGKPGDRLWVRETWLVNAFGKTIYCADWKEEGYEYRGFGWKPSIFMPRWASRITLEVTNVRVERLQDISEKDATAEGVYTNEQAIAKLNLPADTKLTGTCVDKYRIVWESINGKKYPWASNPWVFVISFRRIENAS